MLTPLNTKEIWFITGSQHLYGPETLAQVAEHSAKIVEAFNASSQIPVKVVLKPTVKTTEEIFETLTAANFAKDCIGIVTWMHTFSPAKNVDSRTDHFTKTNVASSHSVQSGYSVGYDGYGLYEPESGCAR